MKWLLLAIWLVADKPPAVVGRFDAPADCLAAINVVASDNLELLFVCAYDLEAETRPEPKKQGWLL
jgi:hypothetical protein